MNIRQRRLSAFLVLASLSALCSPLFAQEIQTESFRGRDVASGEIIVRYREGAAPSVAVGVAAETASDIVSVNALAPAQAVLLRSRSRTVSELLQEYSARPDVLYAQPNYLWRKNDLPNDLYLDTQWALRNTGQNILGQTGIAGVDIHAVQAWDIAQGSRSIVIGLVDSGIDYNHPDLAANVWSAPSPFTVTVGGQSITCAAGTHGFNAILRNCDPLDDDSDKHGTHVAGIIGADGDNGLGVSGINRVASMMALKFLGSNGSGTTANAIAAIEFATKVKAFFGGAANIRILNNSWGSTTFDQALLDAINSTVASDMLFVAAAGNDGVNTDTSPHYPSTYNVANIISVASTDNRDVLDSLSNFGPASVDLAAPGVDIASARSAMTYVFLSGTSMSSAMVSGAAGLVLSQCSLTTSQLKSNLLGSVDSVAALQGKMVTGGRLNVLKALQNCAGTPPTFTLKSSQPFLLPDPAGSAVTTITLTPLNGFSTDVNLTASAPSGFNISFASSTLTAGSLSTTMTVNADGGVAPGTYVIHVTGSDGGTSRTAGFVFIVGTPISGGQNVSGTWSVNTSQPDRFRAGLPPGLADWYQVVVTSSTSLDIALRWFSGSGNFLRLLDSSGAILVTTNTSSNSMLQISRTVAPGAYYIVASTTFSGSTYALSVNAPLLTSLNPTSGQQGTSVSLQLNGVQFASGLTVDAGSDINVSNVVFNNAQSASATLNIPLTAVLGDRPVSVVTSDGRSNGITFTVIRQKPVITSVTPSSGVVGTSVDITILGSGFFDPIVELTTGSATATLDNVVVVNSTMITGRITIAANSNVNNLSIRVTTLGGFTTASFQILPLPPVLTDISPPSGALGSTVDVTLTGANFYSALTIDAGTGITVSNISIAPSRTSLTARFSISPTTTLGIRNVKVTTPGGTSSSVIFTVSPGPGPTLTSITPADGAQTTTRTLDVRGTNFTSGLALNVGPDITVNTITINSGTRATIVIQIGSNAALGPRDFTVTTPGGTTNSIVFTVLPPPPTLTSMSPTSGVQESTLSLTVTGTNFNSGLSISSSAFTVNQLTVTDSTTATATVTILPSTPTGGGHSVRVVTPSGVSAPLGFTVLPGTPSLTQISPAFGVRGGGAFTTVTGTNFDTAGVTTVNVPGVNVSVLTLHGGSITAIFNVSPTAQLGAQNATITTPGGTTNALTYTIFDPFPDLSLFSTANGTLYAGINGAYSILVNNLGTAPATSMTITDLLPPEFQFISGGGSGFSCSASGQLVTCPYSGAAFAPGTLSFNVTVRISATAAASVTHTLTVSSAEDMNPSDNTRSVTLPIQQPPTPAFTFSPTTLIAGQQATVGLTLPTALPADLSGTLTLSFTPSTSIPGDDSAIQFATGGRQVSFVIPANTLQARFGSASIAGPIGYQPGTVAGSISFSGSLQLGTAQKTFSSTAGTNALTIALSSPVVQSLRTDTQGGFNVLIASSSTSRSINELVLQFVTVPAVQVSCGSVSGCTASGSTLTLNVAGLFDGWYSGNPQFGSLSILRLPLVLSGGVRGSVAVSLRNATGTSNIVSVSFP